MEYRSVRTIAFTAAMAFLGLASATRAGVNVSTYADQATWNATPTIATTLTPQTSDVTNQQPGAGISLTHTFRTGAAGFQLDKFDIYSGGMGGATLKLNLYPSPVGGSNSDGFVNTSFSTDLFNGGNGLDVTLGGSPGARYITLDLTGTDEITLAPNTEYALEFDVISGQMSWLRSNADTYPDGNLYQGASELNFNGTPPANGRGERDQVGGTPQRDGGLALYAVPEPGSLGLICVGAVGLLGRRGRRRN